jgi:hypothetical protein
VPVTKLLRFIEPAAAHIGDGFVQEALTVGPAGVKVSEELRLEVQPLLSTTLVRTTVVGPETGIVIVCPLFMLLIV